MQNSASANGSSSFPAVEIAFHRRAAAPSSQSVAIAAHTSSSSHSAPYCLRSTIRNAGAIRTRSPVRSSGTMRKNFNPVSRPPFAVRRASLIRLHYTEPFAPRKTVLLETGLEKRPRLSQTMPGGPESSRWAAGPLPEPVESRDMAKAAQPTEGQFSRLYARLTGGAGSVAEPARGAQAEPAEVREKIVRCLWFDQFLDSANLSTEDGRRIAVFSPGYWNEGAGPDFRNAEFAFGDEPRVRGDVEIHVAASDWGRHGHADDPMYDRVLLHVVLHNDLGEPTVAQRGRRIPQLALAGRLSSDLGEILGSLDPDAYPRVGCGREGACCRSVRACGRDAQWVGRFLDIAGDERMLRKAERFAGLIEKSTPDDALYEALMEVMGYSANRRAFRLLARARAAPHPAQARPGRRRFPRHAPRRAGPAVRRGRFPRTPPSRPPIRNPRAT